MSLHADDQVVAVLHSTYMIGEVCEGYRSWGLDKKFRKTEQLVVGVEGSNMIVDSHIIKVVYISGVMGRIIHNWKM